MKPLLLFFFFLLSTGSNLLSQDLRKYKYVQVPEKFEFLKQENQYQLNALSAFLLEKYGFEAFYRESIPANVGLCEVLQVNVHNKSGIFRSRVYITLEDCNDEVVFTSRTGTSRIKDFEKSYHEALREAFTSLDGLQKNNEEEIFPEKEVAGQEDLPAEVIVDPVPVPGKVQAQAENTEVIIDPAVTSEGMEKTSEEETLLPATSRPKSPLQLVNGAVKYYLKPTSVGYELYREGVEEKFGTLLKSGGGEHYLYSSKNLSGNAFFDAHGNLVVEYLDPKTQLLVSVLYKRKN